MLTVKKLLVFDLFFLLIYNFNIYSQTNFESHSKVNSVSSIGTVSVKTWADNKKSAFSFTFDDAFMSQYTYALPILDQYGFKGTFFLISGVLVDSPMTPIFRYGYWSQFKRMAADSQEIGVHTVTHPDLTTLTAGDTSTSNTITYELYQSKKEIEQKIPGVKCIDLAYPYCTYNTEVENVASNYFQSARTCGSYFQNPNISGINWYNIMSANVTFSEPRQTISDDQNALSSYLNTLQTGLIPSGQWTVLLAHEVVPMDTIAKYDGSETMYQPLSTYFFNQLCVWLKQKSDSNEVWVTTFGNATRYIKERENFSYSIVSSASTSIQINPTDGLDNSIYNFPLTVDIVVPSNWTKVMSQQGNNITDVNTFSDGTNNLVRVNVVPDGGILTLAQSGNTYVLSGTVKYHNTASTPLANVTITIENNSDSLTTKSDASGNFAFLNLIPGAYKISASKADGWGGVNSTDALIAARYFAGLTSLDSLQLQAADVNNNGSVNSTDALLIARRYIGLIQSFTKPDWVFDLPASVTISSSNVNLTIEGISTGDINKSNIAASSMVSEP